MAKVIIFPQTTKGLRMASEQNRLLETDQVEKHHISHSKKCDFATQAFKYIYMSSFLLIFNISKVETYSIYFLYLFSMNL